MKIDFYKIKGIIFDMDGVLVDSEPAMARASIMGMAKFGVVACEDDFKPYYGTGEKTYLGCVLEKYGAVYTSEIAACIYDIYCEIATDYIIAFPGVTETLGKLHDLGYKTAIASSSVKRKLDATISAAKIKREILDAVVCGSEVYKKKPDPEIFLTAAAKLCLPPENCLVVEDSISGVQAAKAAGMDCFGITTTFTDDFLIEKGADFAGQGITELLKYLPWKGK